MDCNPSIIPGLFFPSPCSLTWRHCKHITWALGTEPHQRKWCTSDVSLGRRTLGTSLTALTLHDRAEEKQMEGRGKEGKDGRVPRGFRFSWSSQWCAKLMASCSQKDEV